MPGRSRQTPRRRPRLRAAVLAVFASAMLLAVGLIQPAVRLVAGMEAALPPVPRPGDLETSTLVLDRDGSLLRPFTTAAGRWRLAVSGEAVDPRLVRMLIGYEDRRFYAHDGVDYRALARAAFQIVRHRRIVSGGSTLTMQVARLLDHRSTRTVAGKLRQILYARKIERQLSKQEILNLYFVLAPYGGNLEGIRAASLAYFGKEPGRLTSAQAAMLVAIPQAPELRRPERAPARVRQARDRVLDRLARVRVLSADEARAAMGEPVRSRRRDFPKFAAHLARRARLEAPGREHRLTIRRSLQASLERLSAARIAALGPGLSAAILVADHRTGEILASVGSAGLLDSTRNGFVDMTLAVRSPGSALKPFIYALAFEAGLAHPESLIEDRPTGFSGYVPVNFDGRYLGSVTIREALTRSLNVPAVLVLDAVGPSRLFSRLERAGARLTLPDGAAAGLAIGLGGVGVSLRGLVSAYGAIARGGSGLALRTRAGRMPDEGSRVLEPAAAWYVGDILRSTPPPANGSAGQIAFKTGTSYGYRDAWAIGFDGAHVIGVWVGRPDARPVPGLSGIETAAPLLFEAFDRLGARRTAAPPPPNGVLRAPGADLPPPLRRFRHPRKGPVARDRAPEIAYPRDGVRVDLGLKGERAPAPLAIKLRNGEAPFTWLVNGRPVSRGSYSRSVRWVADGPGFVTIAVVDAAGRSDRVSIFVE